MIKKILRIDVLKDTMSFLSKDKVSFILFFLPFIIGVLLYIFLGVWGFYKIQEFVQSFIAFSKESFFSGILIKFSQAFYWVLALTITNYTFAIVVSVLGSPFHDLLSERVEEKLKGVPPRKIENRLKWIFFTIFNQIKKLRFIFMMSILGLILGLFPAMIPLSFFLVGLSLAYEGLDYNWSRHDIAFSSCMKELKSNFLAYGIQGAFFLVLASIPFINIFIPTLLVVFFSIQWVKNNDVQSHKG